MGYGIIDSGSAPKNSGFVLLVVAFTFESGREKMVSFLIFITRLGFLASQGEGTSSAAVKPVKRFLELSPPPEKKKNR